MLDFLFGFNARLGRLSFFLSTVALAITMKTVGLALAGLAIRHAPTGMQPPLDLMTWPVLTALIFHLWASITLYSMRIRDLGWDPVCIIPLWVVIMIIDHAVAAKVPVWSFGHGHRGTVVGVMINLVFVLTLTFWPNGDFESSGPPSGSSRNTGGRSPRPNARGPAAERLARANGAEFGARRY